MNALICIDDTDNLDSIGTGELLEKLCFELKIKSLASAGFVSRHQLYVHEDIPYTSHNSSMCAKLETSWESWDQVVGFCENYLERNAAKGSDPGLCFVQTDMISDSAKQELISFGKSAKETVLHKKAAYDLASIYGKEIHLSEHGGTGGGVIGALAGCGLRLYGSDGRLKGKIKPEDSQGIWPAGEICEKYGFSRLITDDYSDIDPKDPVALIPEIKPILWEHEPVVMVEAWNDSRAPWKIISKNDLNRKRIGR
ncbi:hypothetical protein [Alkalibacter mobilis]|uniref:hypothetical protein n=1 Tax=Alkalibacter mobilis TaxID=2787712 RepID=UPI0018A044F4|nr:hypothetical protein [Alkalibacter mobilis]MBF7097311.1 hypothetical protein [Alkalibacter mobilis]